MEAAGCFKLVSLPGRRHGAAPFRINCRYGLILCISRHITGIYLNYYFISRDPVYVVSVFGNVAAFCIGGKKKKNQSIVMVLSG